MKTAIEIMCAFALVAFLPGCGSRCTEGSTQACACAGGVSGVQACTAEGTYGACDCGLLTEAEARRLIESRPDFVEVTCSVQVNEFEHGRYDMSSGQRPCMDALAQAGLARPGGASRCYGAYCPDTEVFATDRSRFERGGYLLFPCGRISVVGVSGISTSGNEATFSYEREATFDQALVASISSCRFRASAEAGRAIRERRARRDDAGNWSLVSSAPGR